MILTADAQPVPEPQAVIGILMLDTQFPRIPGDAGNSVTWPFEVVYRIVPDASPKRVIEHHAQGLITNFITAATELERAGVDGITTTCGFLALFQEQLAAAVDVPVASSALLQLPLVDKVLAHGKRTAILTVAPELLSSKHLAAAGCALDTPIGGLSAEGCFASTILGDRLELNIEQARQEHIDAAQQLLLDHVDIGALVLECANMIPYAAAISAAIGLPVYSLYDLIIWFQQGLRPKSDFRSRA